MPFELSALCAFPWDFADKGLDSTLARCHDLGVSHLFLAACYHAGYFFYPDNPERRVHLLEDGVTYYQPRETYYSETPIRPVAAAMCRETDWFERIAEAAGRSGLKLGAWTVCLHNTRLGLLHPDCTVENAFGDRYPHALVPSHPHVRAYVRATVRELADRFPLDLILLEATDYRGRRHGGDWVGGHHHERDGIHLEPLERMLLDLSFTPTDLAAAAAAGIDGEVLRDSVLRHLTAVLAGVPDRPAGLPATIDAFLETCPELALYRAALTRQSEELVRLLKDDLTGSGIQLAGANSTAFDWLLVGAYGAAPAEIRPIVRQAAAVAGPALKMPSPPTPLPLRQERGADGLMRGGKARVMTTQQKRLVGIRLGFNPPAVAAIHSSAQLGQVIDEVREAEVEGVMFYNLAETPGRYLDWIDPALHATRPVPDSNAIRIGLIGCGGIAESYLRAARRRPDIDIVALADTDLEQARRRSEEFGIATISASADVLLKNDEIEAVVVAVPPRWHGEILRASLAAGKHVLLEKPLGLDLAEADAIAETASASDRVTGVGLVHRYLPFYRLIRDLIRAGSFGPVRQIRIRTGRDIYTDSRFTDPGTTRGGWLTNPAIAGGGILMSSAIHLLSVGAFLLDEPTFGDVNATLRQLHPRAFPGIEDDVTILLRTADGAELLIEDSWAREWPFELELFGERGLLRVEGPSWAGNVILTGRLAGPVPPACAELAASDGFQINAARYAGLCPPLFDGLLADFVADIRAGRHISALPSIDHAREMQRLIAAMYDSALR